jgi:hypothetical protein
MAHGLSSIDWEAPWLKPWRERGEPIAHQVKQGVSVEQACNASLALIKRELSMQDLGTQAQGLAHAHAHAPAICEVQFVPQSALPDGQAYEQFIFDTQSVPTRDGLHDFFNALCWLQFPLAKKQINLVQATAIQAQGVGAVRGPVRDAVTVFDENATLIQLPDDLWRALQERHWYTAFVTLKSSWQDVQMCVFGHAALEKLVNPYKAITVHLWRVPSNLPLSAWDAWLAQDLQPEKLAAKPFLPTPVLGVPGWWPANENPDFYADTQVFRPPRGA